MKKLQTQTVFLMMSPWVSKHVHVGETKNLIKALIWKVCISLFCVTILSQCTVLTCDELTTRPEESYRLWCVVVCDQENSKMRRPWPPLGRSATENKTNKRYLITYLFTFLLTEWSTVLLEKLTGFQLVKKFPIFCGTRKFFTSFTSAQHLSLSSASSI